MRTATRQILGSFATLSLCCLVLAVHAAPLFAGELARPVSPGAAKTGALAEARCPTFSWAGVRSARGYELAVFRVPAGSTEEPVLVTRVSLSGDARAWTPAVGQCLERGERYAWSIAAAAGSASQLEWSPALLFEVQAAPSVDELQQAMRTIERHLAQIDAPQGKLETTAAVPADERLASGRATASTAPPRIVQGRNGRGLPDGGALTSPTVGERIASRGTAPASGDASLAVSGQVHLAGASAFFREGQLVWWDSSDGNTALGRLALADADDVYANTAVGHSALRYPAYLSSMTPEGGSFNTAIGDHALHKNVAGYMNTATGAAALAGNTFGYQNVAAGFKALTSNTEGDQNTATGTYALSDNTYGNQNVAAGFKALTNTTDGDKNTATGAYALYGNVTGSRNTATGFGALLGGASGYDNTATGYWALVANSNGERNTAVGAKALRNSSTGDRNVALGMEALYTISSGNGNTAIGHGAGSLLAGDSQSNILINNKGAAESNVLRIGQSTSPEEDPPEHSLDKAFIHGIFGRTVGASGTTVLIDEDSQLGTVVSSRRFKQDVRDVGELADRLLELRPVAFRYKQHAATDPETPLQFGLIAEEVAEVFPELVVFDADGEPETVKYHLLTSLLLGELQRQHQRIAELEARSSPRAGSSE